MIRPDFGERRSELHTLARAFDASLAARGRSPMTRKSYREAIVLLADFLDERGVAADVDAVTKTDLEAFIADQLVRWKPATAAVRFRSLQQFWKWATAECELPENPMARMEPPLTPILDLDAKRRLVAACAGPMFENVRDEAIIRLMLECGLRRAEVASMTLAGFDLPGRRFIVTGKGSRDRMGAFGHRTSQAIRRYLRRRKESRSAASPALWLGRRGPLSADTINELVRRRADQAGLGRVHSHSLRHTFASDFRAKGGSDSDLLTAGGWRSPAMLQRYGRSAAMERALAAAERLALADDL